MKRKVLLSGPLVLLLGLIVTPALGQAQTPAEQLSALATHVDGALAQLDAGDLAGAQAEYQAFDDGWFDIEDGIREQSRESYRAIENAMRDAKVALQTDPAAARAALQALREQCDAFIHSQAATSAPAEHDATPGAGEQAVQPAAALGGLG